MQKGMSFVKGVGVGMVAGAAAVIAGKCVLKENQHNVSRGSAKLVKAASDFVDGIQTLFK